MVRTTWLKSKIGVILSSSLLVMTLAGCGSGVGGLTTSTGGTTGGTSGGSGGAVLKSATLLWTPATTNSDGTPLADLAGYRVYYGTSSGNYTSTVDVSDPSATSALIDGLTPSTTYYFAVTAYDSSGNESSFSNEGVKAL